MRDYTRAVLTVLKEPLPRVPSMKNSLTLMSVLSCGWSCRARGQWHPELHASGRTRTSECFCFATLSLFTLCSFRILESRDPDLPRETCFESLRAVASVFRTSTAASACSSFSTSSGSGRGRNGSSSSVNETSEPSLLRCLSEAMVQPTWISSRVGNRYPSHPT